MPSRALLLLVVLVSVSVGCADRTPTSVNGRGTWGSSEASLTVKDDGSTLELLASGGCYGSYGSISAPLPSGSFSMSGTYVQLIGAYPGKLEYPAQFSGVATNRQVSISIAVPGLQRTLGPYVLTYGVMNAWSACLYP